MKKILFLLCLLPCICFAEYNYLNTGLHYIHIGEDMCATLNMDDTFDHLSIIPYQYCFVHNDYMAQVVMTLYSDGELVATLGQDGSCAALFKQIQKYDMRGKYHATQTFKYCIHLTRTKNIPGETFGIYFTTLQ